MPSVKFGEVSAGNKWSSGCAEIVWCWIIYVLKLSKTHLIPAETCPNVTDDGIIYNSAHHSLSRSPSLAVIWRKALWTSRLAAQLSVRIGVATLATRPPGGRWGSNGEYLNGKREMRKGKRARVSVKWEMLEEKLNDAGQQETGNGKRKMVITTRPQLNFEIQDVRRAFQAQSSCSWR